MGAQWSWRQHSLVRLGMGSDVTEFGQRARLTQHSLQTRYLWPGAPCYLPLTKCAGLTSLPLLNLCSETGTFQRCLFTIDVLFAFCLEMLFQGEFFHAKTQVSPSVRNNACLRAGLCPPHRCQDSQDCVLVF